MGTDVVETGWGWGQRLWGWGGDGYSVHGDRQGWGSVSVPVQTSTRHHAVMLCVCLPLVLARKVMRCIPCSLVLYLFCCLKPRTHDKQCWPTNVVKHLLANKCCQTFVSHDKQMFANKIMLSNSMAEMADSADDDDVAAAVICLIACK